MDRIYTLFSSCAQTVTEIFTPVGLIQSDNHMALITVIGYITNLQLTLLDLYNVYILFTNNYENSPQQHEYGPRNRTRSTFHSIKSNRTWEPSLTVRNDN